MIRLFFLREHTLFLLVAGQNHFFILKQLPIRELQLSSTVPATSIVLAQARFTFATHSLRDIFEVQQPAQLTPVIFCLYLLDMPRLGTNRKKSHEHRAKVAHETPTSPWQKLVDAKRISLGFSFRSFAERLSEVGPRVSHTTLWMWLHSCSGVPAKHKYTTAHAKALAKVCGIPIQDLNDAYDASRHVFTPATKPAPVEFQDAFPALINVLENEPRRYVTTEYVLNLAKRLYQESGRPNSGGQPDSGRK